MSFTLVLEPSRGTNLYRNGHETLVIRMHAIESTEITDIMLIRGESISVLKWDVKSPIEIDPYQEYLLVNLHTAPLRLEFSQNLQNHESLFNPYQYESDPFDVINPDEFKESHSIPSGYIDILPKWYSIKFTYPQKNLIHIRPHLGVSIQSHTKRTEDWVIIQGHPIIIANSKMHYSVNPGDTFHTDSGKIHAIFNPTDDWVVLEESYTGTFEEEDIVRVFNPNHYQ